MENDSEDYKKRRAKYLELEVKFNGIVKEFENKLEFFLRKNNLTSTNYYVEIDKEQKYGYMGDENGNIMKNVGFYKDIKYKLLPSLSRLIID